MNAPTFPDRLKHAVDSVTGDPEYANVTVLEQPFDQIRIPEPVDVVWTSENYHDFQNNGPFKADTAAMDKAVFAALKPGGLFVITDYVAAPGTGKTVTSTLHRIEPDVIRQEVTAAGFVLDAQSDLLKNPSDTTHRKIASGIRPDHVPVSETPVASARQRQLGAYARRRYSLSVGKPA